MAHTSMRALPGLAAKKPWVFPAKVGVVQLFWLLAALQVMDFVSTWASLSTGMTTEQNPLITGAAHAAGVPVLAAVAIAKVLAVALFAGATAVSKDTRLDRGLMSLASGYYCAVCAGNFWWAATM
jgi:hypothetical protein